MHQSFDLESRRSHRKLKAPFLPASSTISFMQEIGCPKKRFPEIASLIYNAQILFLLRKVHHRPSEIFFSWLISGLAHPIVWWFSASEITGSVSQYRAKVANLWGANGITCGNQRRRCTEIPRKNSEDFSLKLAILNRSIIRFPVYSSLSSEHSTVFVMVSSAFETLIAKNGGKINKALTHRAIGSNF